MDFRGDTRGVAPLIGVLLLFGFATITLSGYQTVAVPQQSASVEFDHNERVQNDMIDLRNAVLSAKTSGDHTFATVTLGTNFPTRIVAINPPDPSGTLATTESRSVTVTEDGGDGDELDFDGSEENRFIEYRPQYSAYNSAGVLRYENTVLYHDFESANVTLTNQRLLRDETVSLIPVQREFQESSRKTVSIEPIPGTLETEDVTDPVVEVPTKLGEDDWIDLLEDEIEENDDLSEDDITVNNGVLTLELTGAYTIEYAPIGLDQTPSSGGRGDGSPSEINPASPGDVRLVTEFFESGTSSEINLRFENAADASNITDARINFYNYNDPPGQRTFDRADLGAAPDEPASNPPPSLEDPSATLVFRDDFSELEPEIELEGETTTDVLLNFYGDETDEDPNLASESWFVITILFDGGEQGTYFVPVPEDDNVPATYLVEIDSTNSPVDEGQTLEVDATIENSGDLDGSQTVELEIEDVDTGDREIVDEQVVEIVGGGEEEITLEWTTESGDTGDYNATVRSDDDSDTVGVSVEEAQNDPTQPELAIGNFESEFPDGEAPQDYGEVSITVEETEGEETDGLEVTLTVEGDTEGEVFSETIADRELNGGADEFEFSVGEITNADDYTATVTADAQNANEVTESVAFIVRDVLLTDFDVADVEIDQGEALTIDITNAIDQDSETFEGEEDVTVNTQALDGFGSETTVEDVNFDNGAATNVEILSSTTTQEIEPQNTELTAESVDATSTYDVTINEVSGTVTFDDLDISDDTVDIDVSGLTNVNDDNVFVVLENIDENEEVTTQDAVEEGITTIDFSGEDAANRVTAGDELRVTIFETDTREFELDSDIGTAVDGPPGFISVVAEDVPRGEAPNSQMFSFTPNQTLPSEETVVISLADPQSGEIDYESSSVNAGDSSLSGGSAVFTMQDTDDAEITYTPDDTVDMGTEIEIQVDDVDYPQGNFAEYDVVFSRSDGTSEIDSFSDDK